MEQLTLSFSEAHAKAIPYRGYERAWMTLEDSSCSPALQHAVTSILNGQSSRMCPVFFPLTEEGVSRPSLTRWLSCGLGGGVAWRILDSQWFGVAQRRRRVFAVINTRDWRRAAAVLLDENCLRGNPPSRSEAREAAAAEASGGAGASGQDVTAFKWFAGAKARTMPAYDDGTTPMLTNSDAHQPAIAFAQPESIVMASGQSNAEISQGVAPTIAARNYKDPSILFEQPQVVDE